MTWEEIQEIMSRCSVGIAGAGGLGSNCAVALVRSGLGHVVIADFDRVDQTNLNRQYYFHDQVGLSKVEALTANLLRINPNVIVQAHNITLTPRNIPSVFDSVDILVEALDQAEQKEMLIECALSNWPNRPLVIGSGMAGYGMADSIRVRSVHPIIVCGDEFSEISSDSPPLAPRVGIVSNLQANAVLELLLNRTGSAQENGNFIVN